MEIVANTAGTPGRALPEGEWIQKLPWLGDPFLEPASFSSATFLKIESQRAEWICRRGDSPAYRAFWQCLSKILDAAGNVHVTGGELQQQVHTIRV